MAIIVEHRKTGGRFIVIGAGFGMFQTSRPGAIGGNLFPTEKKGEAEMLAVSDSSGQIRWEPANELQVVSVFGKSPMELLAGEDESIQFISGDLPSDQDIDEFLSD